MATQFRLPRGGAKPNLTFGEKLKGHLDKYGVIALFLGLITTIWVIASLLIARADQQAGANYRIGLLEGRLFCLENKISSQSGICK